MKKINMINNIKKMGKTIKEVWDSLDYVPNCPSCNGTGEPNNKTYPIEVWWKGKKVNVCSNCEGKGKV